MSEPKVYHHELRHNEYEEFYLKYEADKVIADLKADYKEACDRLQTANLIKDEQLAATRHNKYKRCLAMAKVCYLSFVRYDNYLQKLCASNATIAAYKFNDKWEKRWLELADKFKEAK